MIFDLIHCSVDPTLVSFVVCRCYSNIVIPDHLAATVSSVHEAVLCYAGQWLPRATKEKFGSFKVFVYRSRSITVVAVAVSEALFGLLSEDGGEIYENII